MKPINYFLLLILSIVTSCGSVKSTLKNVDNSVARPAIKDNHYVITQYAKDVKYGYNKDYPINLGFENEKFGAKSIDFFFNALLGEKNEKFTYVKKESCCPFPTKRSVMGGGILDIYEVTFTGNSKKILLYFNVYDKGAILCPNGFTIKI